MKITIFFFFFELQPKLMFNVVNEISARAKQISDLCIRILQLLLLFRILCFFSFLFASSRREESTEDGMKISKEKKKNRHIIRYSGIVTNFVYLCISLNFSLFTFIYNFRFILLSIEHTKYTNSIPARIDFIKDSRVRIDMKWKEYDTHQSI